MKVLKWTAISILAFVFLQAAIPTAIRQYRENRSQGNATTVQVSRFYDGRDGYSVSIPSGNSSTCVWTYAGGNAAVPYSETTTANTASEKHTLTFTAGTMDFLYDFKLSCVDDFGNQYTGIFPK